MKMGRGLWGKQYSSRSGSAGRSRAEEAEMKVMFGKRLAVFEESRLVKKW